MNPPELTRRELIAAAGGSALVGALAFAAGPIALMAPGRVWALPLAALDAHTGDTLLRMTRHIYPHARLEDAVYALVVKALDAEAAGDDAVASLLRGGVAEFDAGAQHAESWLAQDDAAQLAALEARSGGDFFQKIRSTAVVALYNNELAFAHFGYEGPAFERGGYLTRGFNDLRWLPDPPAAASPSVS